MENVRELSCEQRIDVELKHEIGRLTELWENYHNNDLSDDDRDQAMEAFYNYALSFEYILPDTFQDQKEGYFQLLISWGGPSDMFRFYTNIDLSCHTIVYCFQDWFDGAERELTGSDLELLLEIYEDFKDCGTCQHVYDEAYKDY